mmetsp:Transcript_27016/g.67896  ORF Transcript_27016/g.67896 Transcript_27016/m.67896 type:complete len:357 (-) Transcript_27016:33-1103(-)|eukprot:CAMPEP_0177664722 /NCGR_PEP_ID=MMETSP0447-20121125/20658_1 /TAXON_ID=0 /ORGANISM="Stygamoeba regulata, Strain BSH-02190019" /LENGTH=356 /DNA_ID=CAMNT_0019170739 /DNA_START=74 /DNA_END=1144 /DNA_ORIENTATION=-
MFRPAFLVLIVAMALLGFAHATNVQDMLSHCPPPPPPRQTPPTNVRELYPSDIKAVMALGDSVTAGFAMHTYPVEERQDVYSIGANPNATTLFNFIRHYNPNVVGGAVKYTLPLDAAVYHNPYDWLMLEQDRIHLNAGVSSAKAADVVDQIRYLTERLPKEGVDMQTDWKLLTLFIGANDLCVVCDGGHTAQQPENWIQTVDSLLDQVHQSIPRVFVNLVGMVNITEVYRVDMGGWYCRLVRKDFDECPCLDHHGQAGRDTLSSSIVQYNQLMAQLAQKWQAKNLDDFYVAFQPYLTEAVFPGREVLSDLDCFHPSAISDQYMAMGLWNSMFLPAALKPTSINVNLTVQCPSGYLQ